MRTDNIKVKFAMPIPFDRPDGNGNVYTKEAVEKALYNLNNNNIPLLYRGNEEDSVDKVIGVANILPDVVWDDEQQVCNIEIDGNIFYGGTDCIANEIKGNTIADFTIVSIGLSD